MPILCTRALSVPQREEIRITYQLCCQAEPLTLSCPQDADIYWLLTDGSGAVLSLLAAWKTGEDLWECCGFTRPACRRNGYFSALLEEACKAGAPLGGSRYPFYRRRAQSGRSQMPGTPGRSGRRGGISDGMRAPALFA